jgi:RNA polymerase sigma-70 factor (ECF subfamily)
MQEIADMLDLSVAAANSLLQRARTTLGQPVAPAASRLTPSAERALVERYVSAWEHGNVDELVALLQQDARLSMPPLAEWYVGIDAIAAFFRWATSAEGPGPYRMVPTRANGGLAFGIYAHAEPFILQVLDADSQGIRAITSFMNPGLFRFFDLGEAAGQVG